MKEHTTVTITRAMIEKYSPCSDLMYALPFLPATLSTDPLENLELAEDTLAAGGVQVTWLASAVCGDLVGSECIGACCSGRDPYVRAQTLAAIADKLATDAGR